MSDFYVLLLNEVLMIQTCSNNATRPSALPFACPQPSSAENSADTDEDCLSMILYVPSAAVWSTVPTLMW